MKLVSTFAGVILLTFMTFTAQALTLPSPTNYQLIATGGDINLTFLSKQAAYSSDLFLVGSPNVILNNQTAVIGQQFNLGSFQAGIDIVFSLFVNDTGHQFFTGPASSNPDNVVHALFSEINGNAIQIQISFEDLLNGGDLDYNDLIFSVTNVAVVPEPQSYLMMLLGLLLLVQLKRRNQH